MNDRPDLNPAIAAAVQRWDNEPPPPPLSERQKDVIAAALSGSTALHGPEDDA